jgi:hypothetical protein
MKHPFRFSWPVLLILLLVTIHAPAAGSWEITLSTGPWTAWPITTLIENECREMIEHQMENLLKWAVPVLLIQNDREDITYNSHGLAISLALSRHFGNGPWSISLEVNSLRLDLPYTLHYIQRLELRGITLVRADTKATGLARIRSIDGALGLHYRFFKKGRFYAETAAGLHLMTLRGDLSITGQSDITSVIGDEKPSFEESATMTALRDEGLKIPELLVYPSASLSAGWQVWKSLGLKTRLTFSQGLFLSLGLTAGF